MQTTYQAKIWIFVLIALLLIPTILVYLGYRQLTKAIEPIDLGVTYTHEDYDNLVEMIGIDIEPEKLCLDCPNLTFSEPNEVDVKITNSQASAAFDIVNEKLSAGSVNNSQVRFNDGSAEVSTIFSYNGRDYPVYMAGSFEKDGERSITGNIASLKVGSFNVPDSLKEYAENGLLNLANDKIDAMGDNVRIDDINFTSHGLDFKGLIPTRGE